MKIVICASIAFTEEIKTAREALINLGHKVEIPLTSQQIIDGKLSLEEFKAEKKENGDGAFRKIKLDVIKRYYEIIKNSDAILVLNLEKNDCPNYIGGNVFLEIGFAYVLDKPIYLYNNIPDMPYTDEIKAMKPIIINKDLNKMK